MRELPLLPPAPAGCSLSEEELAAQRRRAERLGPFVTDVRRVGGRLDVDLTADVDRALLDELVATERRCCPFFDIDVAADGRRMTIGVHDEQDAGALDALARFFAG